MTAVLGNMVPPDNGGAAAVNNLVAILERLVNKIDSATGGSSGGGQSQYGTIRPELLTGPRGVSLGRSTTQYVQIVSERFSKTVAKLNANLDSQVRVGASQLNALKAQLSDLSHVFRTAGVEVNSAFSAMVSAVERRAIALDTNKQQAKLQAENAKFDREGMQIAHNAMAVYRSVMEKRAARQQKDDAKLNDEIERITNTANDRLKAHREKNQKAVTKVVDTLNKLMEDITDKLSEGKVLGRKDYRRLLRAGATQQEVLGFATTSGQNRRAKEAERLQKQNESDDAYGQRLAKDAFYKLRNRREKEAQADQDRLAKETSAAVQAKIDDAKRELRFRRDIRMKNIYGTGVTIGDLKKAERIGSPLAGAIEDALAKKKAESGKGGSSFFGGFTRNLVIGKLYAAAHTALAPLEALGMGFASGGLKIWKNLTEYALEAGKGLFYLTGLGDAATKLEYQIKTSTERLKRVNATDELGFGLGAKAAAGAVGSGATVAGGIRDALTNALVNPLTGFTDIVAKAGHAVALFDPSTMMRYNMVMRDLTAVVGMALTPVVQGITVLLKEFGDFLKPLVQSLLPEIQSAMKGLVDALRPLIPLIIVELREAVLDIVAALKAVGKNKLGIREAVLNAVGVPKREVKEDLGRARNGAMVVGGAGLVGAGLGQLLIPIPGVGAGIGAMIGGGGAAAVVAAQENNRAAGVNAARRAQVDAMANGLPKVNMAGTAVAYNATIGSGLELSRRAAQDAFIASSNNGLNEGKNLFEEAARKLIEFVDKNNGKDAVNGNAQPGVANGLGGMAKDLKGLGNAVLANFGFKVN